MLIGYARVSTSDQRLDLQADALREAGCARIFSDTVSGAKAERPGLAAAVEACRAGDILVVWKLDRLGRSLAHLVATVQGLALQEVGFRSLQEQLDTTTSGGKLIFHEISAGNPAACGGEESRPARGGQSMPSLHCTPALKRAQPQDAVVRSAQRHQRARCQRCHAARCYEKAPPQAVG